MRKRDTWLWVIYGLVLLFLYLISSTDLLIKEPIGQVFSQIQVKKAEK